MCETHVALGIQGNEMKANPRNTWQRDKRHEKLASGIIKWCPIFSVLYMRHLRVNMKTLA